MIEDTGYKIRDTGYRMQDAGYGQKKPSSQVILMTHEKGYL